ncbi:[Fe-Fe] hydrogenase large subunit C-terminal domain-containing protein [Loigolactobacillus binensis]|uniref:[Fe-Fe] hydrogenase large subunit C-terminal domain-containing protein n=1 Tax=Loigolactobacillus binensis TaxID=2559922 RepID=A0ABW3EDV1_9LACO|nr:[Fe-Fe] hydrogenase large subunit C-terminal domain-containing protein [Loigolactobacillus binensis]
MAPSVRTSFGELMGEGFGVDTMNKIYAGCRKAGFDRIYDINFGADLTIMEEATELIERVQNGGVLPMFTSCCPGWVRLLHNYHPEELAHFSSAKSPQQMFGAASKSYYPETAGIDPKNVFTVTIMPCIAKKFEADIPSMEVDGQRDIDAVITVRELAKLFRKRKVRWRKLEPEEPDQPLSEFTGDGTGFGFSGGVMQAALRTAKHFVDNEDLGLVDFQPSDIPGVKEYTAELGGVPVRCGVVDGATHAFDLFESGELEDFQFIEVMACPGGCINGGGQPHVNAKTRLTTDHVALRRGVLKEEMKASGFSKCYENKSIQEYYKTYLGKPGSAKAHKYLHYDFQENFDNNQGWLNADAKAFQATH